MDGLINRLENWKFESAYGLAKNMSLTAEQRALIRCLSNMFGNCGWFDGWGGELIGATVELLCKEIKELSA